MNSSVKNVIFALLFISTQTAAAGHGVECLDEPHLQSCQVCAAHDHSVAVNTDQRSIDYIDLPQCQHSLYVDVSEPWSDSFYCTRAPPL